MYMHVKFADENVHVLLTLMKVFTYYMYMHILYTNVFAMYMYTCMYMDTDQHCLVE